MTFGSDQAKRELGWRLEFWLGTMPSHALGMVSCVLLFFMMVLTFVDVTGRYVFASPLPAAHEIISFTMPGIIFCALPVVCVREGNVTIDLLDAILPRIWRRRQGLGVNLVSLGAMILIGWRLAVRSYDHWRFNEVTDELYLSLWPFSMLMAALSAVAAVALLANVIGYLTGVKIHPAEEGARTT